MFGINYGQTKPLVDLISIGIVGEDNRAYYAISKEFNLEEAWNRYDIHTMTNLRGDIDTNKKKVYWIRENVLRPIWEELSFKYIEDRRFPDDNSLFTFKSLKNLLDKYGKTNKQIAEEIKGFVNYTGWEVDPPIHEHKLKERGLPQFYAYYGAFDYVAFSQIFGGFENYPKSFPKYFIDLKQELDKEAIKMSNGNNPNLYPYSFDEALKVIKSVESYPQEPTTHHALSDAHWNKQLHEFLNTL
jgi:hypothetical protein